MNRSKTRTLPPLSLVSPSELEKALLSWDEYDAASVVTLASHPQSAQRLSLLRSAERWLEQEALEVLPNEADCNAQSTNCPSAGDLFDFGQGPGFGSLAQATRVEIEAHLIECDECQGWIASLASPPPLPVVLDQSEPIPVPERRSTPARALGPTRTWLPFLMAAGLAGIALIPAFMRNFGASHPSLPEPIVFRGAEDSALLFPRGKLLLSDSAPQFELRSIEAASSYRIEVFLSEAGASGAPDAFDEGRRVQVLYSSVPRFAGEPLAAGSYTYQAFAEINQLDRALGALDFEISEEASLGQRLSRLMDTRSPALDSERILLIRELVQLGFASDARKLAYLLPETPARREFLRAPGR
jgi:hypothetical protein